MWCHFRWTCRAKDRLRLAISRIFSKLQRNFESNVFHFSTGKKPGKLKIWMATCSRLFRQRTVRRAWLSSLLLCHTTGKWDDCGVRHYAQFPSLTYIFVFKRQICKYTLQRNKPVTNKIAVNDWIEIPSEIVATRKLHNNGRERLGPIYSLRSIKGRQYSRAR